MVVEGNAANEEPIGLPLVWVDSPDAPVLVANQFALMLADEEFLLTIGQARPPVMVGLDDEETREQILKNTFVPVFPVARLSLTRRRVAELRDLLNRQLARFDGEA